MDDKIIKRLTKDYLSSIHDKLALYKIDIAKYIESPSGKLLTEQVMKCFQSHLLELYTYTVNDLSADFYEFKNDIQDILDVNEKERREKAGKRMEGKLKRILRRKSIAKTDITFREDHIDTNEEKQKKIERIARIHIHITFFASLFMKHGADPTTLLLTYDHVLEILKDIGIPTPLSETQDSQLFHAIRINDNDETDTRIGFFKFCIYMANYYYTYFPLHNSMYRQYLWKSFYMSYYPWEEAQITIIQYLEYEKRKELKQLYIDSIIDTILYADTPGQYLNKNMNDTDEDDEDDDENSSMTRDNKHTTTIKSNAITATSSVIKQKIKKIKQTLTLPLSPYEQLLEDLHQTRTEFFSLCLRHQDRTLPPYPHFYEVVPIISRPTWGIIRKNLTRNQVNKLRQVTDHMSHLSNMIGYIKPETCIYVEHQLGYHLLTIYDNYYGWLQSHTKHKIYFQHACMTIPNFSWTAWTPFYQSTYYQVSKEPLSYFEHIELKVRHFPHANADICGYLKTGDVIRSRGVLGDWLHIEYENYTSCWIIHTAKKLFLSEKVTWNELNRDMFPETLRIDFHRTEYNLFHTICDSLYKRIHILDRRKSVDESIVIDPTKVTDEEYIDALLKENETKSSTSNSFKDTARRSIESTLEREAEDVVQLHIDKILTNDVSKFNKMEATATTDKIQQNDIEEDEEHPEVHELDKSNTKRRHRHRQKKSKDTTQLTTTPITTTTNNGEVGGDENDINLSTVSSICTSPSPRQKHKEENKEEDIDEDDATAVNHKSFFELNSNFNTIDLNKKTGKIKHNRQHTQLRQSLLSKNSSSSGKESNAVPTAGKLISNSMKYSIQHALSLLDGSINTNMKTAAYKIDADQKGDRNNPLHMIENKVQVDKLSQQNTVLDDVYEIARKQKKGIKKLSLPINKSTITTTSNSHTNNNNGIHTYISPVTDGIILTEAYGITASMTTDTSHSNSSNNSNNPSQHNSTKGLPTTDIQGNTRRHSKVKDNKTMNIQSSQVRKKSLAKAYMMNTQQAVVPLISLLSDEYHRYLNYYQVPSPCRLEHYDLSSPIDEDDEYIQKLLLIHTLHAPLHKSHDPLQTHNSALHALSILSTKHTTKKISSATTNTTTTSPVLLESKDQNTTQQQQQHHKEEGKKMTHTGHTKSTMIYESYVYYGNHDDWSIIHSKN